MEEDADRDHREDIVLLMLLFYMSIESGGKCADCTCTSIYIVGNIWNNDALIGLAAKNGSVCEVIWH